MSDKIQQKLKSLIHMQGQVMLNWESHSSSLVSLLNGLKEIDTIRKGTDRYFTSIFHLQNNPISQTTNQNNIKFLLTSVEEILFYRIHQEENDLRKQIKNLWKALTDVYIAMQKINMDSFQIIVGQVNKYF